MSQLVISDLDLLEDVSNQLHIHGGHLNAVLSATVTADLDAGLYTQGNLIIGGISFYYHGSLAGATAGAVASGGRRVSVSVSATAQA